MAIRIPKGNDLSNIVIISEHDDAIDHEASDIEAYHEDYDQSHLKFLPEQLPTKFICNFKFSAEVSAELKDSMMKSLNKRTRTPNLTIGSYQQNIVRYGLKAIQNPDGIPVGEQIIVKKSGNFLRDDTIAELEQLGIVDEIFSAYNALVSKKPTRGVEKNL